MIDQTLRTTPRWMYGPDHFTPTGASWLNLVECFFAEITRKRLRRGTFRSLPALIAAIRSVCSANTTKIPVPSSGRPWPRRPCADQAL